MATQISTTKSTAAADHGWFGTETVKTRLGNFDFKNSYPSRGGCTTTGRARVQSRGRSCICRRCRRVVVSSLEGRRRGGTRAPNQLVIWENADGLQRRSCSPATRKRSTGWARSISSATARSWSRCRPMLLGGISDSGSARSRASAPTGADKGKGGKFLAAAARLQRRVAARLHGREVADLCVVFGVRGFLVDGKTDKAVALMKTREGLSARQGGESARDGVRRRVADRRSTRSSRIPASSSTIWPGSIDARAALNDSVA